MLIVHVVNLSSRSDCLHLLIFVSIQTQPDIFALSQSLVSFHLLSPSDQFLVKSSQPQVPSFTTIVSTLRGSFQFIRGTIYISLLSVEIYFLLGSNHQSLLLLCTIIFILAQIFSCSFVLHLVASQCKPPELWHNGSWMLHQDNTPANNVFTFNRAIASHPP